MIDKIKDLTEKIYNEGVVKADIEAKMILADARKEAEIIINAAQNEKKEIIEQAADEASEIKKKAESEIGIAAQKLISNLKQEIANELIARQVNPFIESAFKDDHFIQEMLLLMVNNWAQLNSNEADLSILIPPEKEQKLDAFFEEKLISQINQGIEIKIDPNIKNGFKIGPKDGNYIISFTEEDFENYFKNYLKEKTWKLVFGSPS